MIYGDIPNNIWFIADNKSQIPESKGETNKNPQNNDKEMQNIKGKTNHDLLSTLDCALQSGCSVIQ